MKQKFKNILKLFTLGTVFVLGSCQKDNYDDAIYKKTNITMRQVSLKDNELKSNFKLMGAVNAVKQKNQMAQNPTSRMVYDSINNFYFDDEKGMLIEKDGKDTYTFLIKRISGTETKLENIVFNKNELNEYDTYIVKYNFTEEQAKLMSNQDIALNTNQNTDYSQIAGKIGAHCFYYYISACGGDPYDCFGSECGFVLNADCEEGSGTADGYTPGGDNYGGPKGGSGVNTTPVVTGKTPCQQLTDMAATPIANTTPAKTVADNLNNLISEMATNPRERTFALSPVTAAETQFVEEYSEGPLNGDGAEANINPNIALSALMHCHYKLSQLSIFSLADLFMINDLLESGTIINPETFTSYLVTAHGTKYAIKFSPQAATPLTTAPTGGGFNLFDGWNDLETKYLKESFYNIKVKPEKSISQNELGFLEFAKINNLGIDIYKADGSGWKKLTLNTSGRVTETPCP